MSITRAQAEAEIVKRQGARMELAGLAVTVVGTNADLESPFATSLRKLGLTASNPVSDSDLTALDADGLIDEFIDRAELRLLMNIKGNLTLVDISAGSRRESLGQLADQIKDDIAGLKARIEEDYGTGSTLEGGSLLLNYQQKGDDPDEEDA